MVGTIIPIISLIIVNSLPLIGVFTFGWNQAEILILYWAESAVIGMYNVIKMWLAEGKPKNLRINKKIVKIKNQEDLQKLKLFLIPFFIMHFGMFMTGHLIFLSILIITSLTITTNPITLLSILTNWTLLFASHGISFQQNYINKKEYKTTNVGTLFFEPYPRIVAMHLTVLIGAAIKLPILILITTKTILDLAGHLWERKKLKKTT